jgi:hypothetical protein
MVWFSFYIRCLGARLIRMFSLDALQGVLYRSGIGQDSGKENVDPGTRARKVSMSRRSAQTVTVLTALGSLIAQVRTHKCAPSTRCVGGASDVVVPTLLQEQSPDVEEDVNMVPCTQVPPAIAKGALKRIRKPGQRSAAAHGGGGGTTPKTPRGSTSRMGAMAKCGLADLTQQTPMPQNNPANNFGPPPPDTTPTPLSENSAAYGEFIVSFCCGVGIRPEVYPDSPYIVQGYSGVLPGDDQIKGGEREGGTLQAQEAACMEANHSPA